MRSETDRRPTVAHALGYGIDKEGGDLLQAFTKKYNGFFRRISRIS